MIRELQINNYKSINQVNLDCRRINILIGEPNVGKSNILEALDLTYLPSFFHTNETIGKRRERQIDIDGYFRVNKVADLFHLGDISQPISVQHPGFSFDFSISNIKQGDSNLFEWSHNGGSVKFDNDFNPLEKSKSYGSPIKPYRFKEDIQFHDIGNYIDLLMPPFGNNLTTMLRHNKQFQEFVVEIAKGLGYEINMDASASEILFQLRLSEGLVYTVRYQAMADTLKRMIFYVAAIRHNNASVVTLEEPEVHSFPKYISFLADEIINASSRQFFIATHSPYLLNNLIENTPSEELSVFVCGYDKKQFCTTVKRLTNDDLSELLNYGVDIFFNINRYLDDRA